MRCNQGRRKRRRYVGFLCGVVWFVLFAILPEGLEAAAPVYGTPQLAVLVDGRKVQFEGGNPFMENNRVQVPIRGIGEALGAKIDYTGNTITYVKGNKKILLTLGSKLAIVDGNHVMMDTAAIAKKGRTYVPLRFISENLGETVEWDQAGNWVWIGEKKIPTPEEIGIQPQELDKFTKLIDPTTGLYDQGHKNVYVFTYDQLPLLVGDRIIYDMWEIKQNGIDGLRVRYSKPNTYIFFLTNDNKGARFRSPIKLMGIGGVDTYRISVGRDSISHNDKNWASFTLGKVEYIGFYSLSNESLYFLELS